jgi:type IV pilus assembly protein PilV
VGLQILISSEKGFSLVELLVSLVILTVGMLGLLQSVNLAIDTNMKNNFRDEAVMVGEDSMSQEKSKAFALISSNTTKSFGVSRKFRNAFKNYSVTKSIEALPNVTNPNTKRIQIGVKWVHRGQKYEHSVSSMVSSEKYQID